MMRIAVVLVALAACNKPKNDVQGPAQNSAAPSNETAPASKDPLDIAIVGLTDWKAKMCACADRACADKVHAGYKQWENDVVEPMFAGTKESDFPKEKLETAERLDDERKACRRKHAEGASIAEAMAKMGAFRDQMCACKDADCATKVSDEMTTWAQEQAGTTTEKMTDADTKQATEIGTQMGECFQKAVGGS